MAPDAGCLTIRWETRNSQGAPAQSRFAVIPLRCADHLDSEPALYGFSAVALRQPTGGRRESTRPVSQRVAKREGLRREGPVWRPRR